MRRMYIIKTLKLKHCLEEKGYKCLELLPSRYREGFWVFCFEDSKELREEVHNYKMAIRRQAI